jgi:WD40-like Beta Propeller Repeat
MTDDLHPYRAEPDPAFADRLERELLGRLAAPSNSTDQDLAGDVQLVRLADPDEGALEDEGRRLGTPQRSRSARWLAAAAVVVLVAAAIALLRNAGEDPDDPVDVVPTTTTLPPLTDAPSTGSIVTGDGHGWPEGAAPPRTPDGPGDDVYEWNDFDPNTGSFLYVDFLLSYRIWVLSEDGDEEADLQCGSSGCAGGTVFGPGPDEVTAPTFGEEPAPGERAPVAPERVQIMAWDGTARDSIDISAAFTRDGDGTRAQLGTLAWSPDGSRLAVSTEPEGTQPENVCDPTGGECVAEVWIFDRDGGEPQRVYTADSANPEDAENGEPPVFADLAWSPDGESLAVSVTMPPLGGMTWPTLVALRLEPDEPVRADVLHVYDDVVPAGAQLLPWQYNQFAFAWSPDGSRIAVTSGGGGSENPGVAEISADDGRVLARHPGAAGRRDPNGVFGLAWLSEG